MMIMIIFFRISKYLPFFKMYFSLKFNIFSSLKIYSNNHVFFFLAITAADDKKTTWPLAWLFSKVTSRKGMLNDLQWTCARVIIDLNIQNQNFISNFALSGHKCGWWAFSSLFMLPHITLWNEATWILNQVDTDWKQKVIKHPHSLGKLV